MSDYTPTTEEVSDVYKSRLIKVGDNRFELIDEIQADLEFDRWLAEVKAQAWEEGCRWGVSNFHILKESYTKNPYRPRNGNNDTEIPETGKPKKFNLDQDIENAEHYVLEATKNLADAYLNYGKYKERERVIEILENNIIRYDRERNLIIQPTTPDFIALIKEDN